MHLLSEVAPRDPPRKDMMYDIICFCDTHIEVAVKDRLVRPNVIVRWLQKPRSWISKTVYDEVRELRLEVQKRN